MKLHSLLLSIVSLVTVYGCDTEVENIRTRKQGSLKTPTYSQIDKPYERQYDFSVGVAKSTYLSSEGLTKDDFWALAECECFFASKKARFETSAVAKGMLPEVMSIPIREEIIEHNLLKVAKDLLGTLGQKLANTFVSDETVNESIVEGLNEGILESVPGGTNITKNRLRLDLFGSWYEPKKQVSSFSVSEQTDKWLSVLSMSDLFGGRNSRLSNDHGLQVFHLIRSVVELQYAFGLDGYGAIGLTLDPNNHTYLAPFDPRQDYFSSRTLFGNYNVTYDRDSSLLNQSVSLKENWTHGKEEFTLAEQSKLWMTMAYMFKNLRPNNRKHIQKMFEGEGGLLPDDTHLIALTVLPSLSDVLSDKLMNIDTRKVLSRISSNGVAYDEAGPVELARMINSIQLWANELKNIDDVDVDPSLKSELAGAVPSFKDAVRLSIQHLINSYLNVDSTGEISVLSAVGNDYSAAGEVVEAILKVNANLIESELLSEFAFELTRTYVSSAVKLMTESPREVKFSDVVWLYRVLNEVEKYDIEALGMPWVTEVRSTIAAYIYN